jgi:peptidoglycan/LPS O-acetylase OafA/YrhL
MVVNIRDKPAAVDTRFMALDSLRGVCALIVALFHFRTTGLIANLQIVRNGWLFVDFFFVLSGFVIAHAYGKRLVERRVSVGNFMALRMGRIYPVHLMVLAVMVVLECLLAMADMSAFTRRAAFEGSHSVAAIVTNLLLLQSFGLHHQLTWNAPSWSIAAEMWTYLLFALIFSWFGTKARIPIVLVGLAALLFLILKSPHHLNTTYQYGFVRAVFGFALGVSVQYLFERGYRLGGSLPEVAMLLLSLLFVHAAGESWLSFLGPPLFACAVWVFAVERGIVSQWLRTAPMALLGTVSYSLYMVHAFVQARLGEIIQLRGSWIGASLQTGRNNPEFSVTTIVAPPLVGDALSIVMIAIVIGLSILSYRWIEYPCREWARDRVKLRASMARRGNNVAAQSPVLRD